MTVVKEAATASTEMIDLGYGFEADPDVLLGYPPGRAIVDTRLTIGSHARLRSGTVIYAGSTIGGHLETGHHVIIREQNRIGDDVNVWNNTVIDYGCVVGNRVKIHSNCYVAQFTVLEDEVFLAPGVVITNDPHPGCAKSAECMRGPIIRRGAQIGGNVTICPFVTIGERALIGSGAVVTRDVPPETVVVGNPGRVAQSIYDLKCSVDLMERPYEPQ